jgi:hypothetical protein
VPPTGHALAVKVREAGRVVNVHALIAHGECDFGRLMAMALVGGRVKVLATLSHRLRGKLTSASGAPVIVVGP